MANDIAEREINETTVRSIAIFPDNNVWKTTIKTSLLRSKCRKKFALTTSTWLVRFVPHTRFAIVTAHYYSQLMENWVDETERRTWSQHQSSGFAFRRDRLLTNMHVAVTLLRCSI